LAERVLAFVALMWTAILTVQAGAFLQRMIEAIWPSFINFPNHLPANAGITSAGILCFMLYWMLQTSKYMASLRYCDAPQVVFFFYVAHFSANCEQSLP